MASRIVRATESHICSLPNVEAKTGVPASSDTLLTSGGAPVGAALSHGIAFAVVTGNRPLRPGVRMPSEPLLADQRPEPSLAGLSGT